MPITRRSAGRNDNSLAPPQVLGLPAEDQLSQRSSDQDHQEWNGVDENDVSVDESSIAEPLNAGSLWDYRPDRKKILLLAQCQGLDGFFGDGGGFRPTARDVLLSAMASVDFLKDLGNRTIHADEIGIDDAGRLFHIGSRSSQNNFRTDFSDMVPAFRKNRMLQKQAEAIWPKLAAFVEYTQWEPLLQGENRLPAVQKLQTCVAAMERSTSFDTDELLAQCCDAVDELERVVTVVNTVKQDFIETNSTSLDRWKKLKGLAWVFTEKDSAGLEEMLQGGVFYFTMALTCHLQPYQKFLRHAITLKEDIEGYC
ncbi:hypothetical protein MFIFM68171_04275 [Madurella fahalii]|uniref:Uncharacterized protein n=1 Tax=Madurella fahalii TaxID=1157608 RepID=A0ABQ0G8P2_9PEZI